jgi:UDP-N-acetyl-D-glucosamine dehydrogenase
MPRHVVELTAEALNEHGQALRGARVGLLGVAFKPNVNDARNAPAADVIAGLAARGADVAYHDPRVTEFTDAAGVSRTSVDLAELLAWAQVIVVVTAHRDIDWPRVYATAGLVVDTVNSSAGHQIRDRQVLRLGAGWGTGSQATSSRSKSSR